MGAHRRALRPGTLPAVLLAALLAAAGAAPFAFAAGGAPAVTMSAPVAPRRAPLLVETDHGVVTLDVEVADTPRLRRRGLMFRQRLPRGRGMLLMWPRPSLAALWMKNTLVALDMVFIDALGRIVHIHENARPGDLTPITAGRPVVAVLEIAAGEARRLGLRPGLRISLPRAVNARRGRRE